MVICNACKSVGVWSGKILMNLDGTVHRCLKGRTFIWHHLDWGRPVDVIDPTVERQVRLEGNTWTLYKYGKEFEIIPRENKK